MDIDLSALAAISTSNMLTEKRRYAFQVNGYDPKEVNDNTGSTCIRIEAAVIDGPDWEVPGHPELTTSPIGTPRTFRFYFPSETQTERGRVFMLARIAAFFDACGIDRKSGTKSWDELCAETLNRSFTAMVKYQTKDKEGNPLDEPREDYSSFKAYEGRV